MATRTTAAMTAPSAATRPTPLTRSHPCPGLLPSADARLPSGAFPAQRLAESTGSCPGTAHYLLLGGRCCVKAVLSLVLGPRPRAGEPAERAPGLPVEQRARAGEHRGLEHGGQQHARRAARAPRPARAAPRRRSRDQMPSKALRATSPAISEPTMLNGAKRILDTRAVCEYARGGIRTHTPLRAGAFKTPLSTVPAPGHWRV